VLPSQALAKPTAIMVHVVDSTIVRTLQLALWPPAWNKDTPSWSRMEMPSHADNSMFATCSKDGLVILKKIGEIGAMSPESLILFAKILEVLAVPNCDI
jgi:hypothetical protein